MPDNVRPPKHPIGAPSKPILSFLALLAIAVSAPACEIDQSFTDKPDGDEDLDLVVSPAQLAWYGVPFGSSEVQQITLQNTGTAALTVSTVRPEQSGAFTVIGEFPMTIAGGQTVAVDVAYSPLTDEDAGRAIIESNDPNDPIQQVELIGTSGSPRLEIDPTSYDFGTLNVLCRDTVWHTLRNVGTADLVVTQLYETGECFRVAEAPAVPFTIPPGGSEEVAVEYAPITAASFSGSLWVESNDPAGLKKGTQQGVGTDAGVCVEVVPGDEVPLELTFTAEYRVADIAFLLDTTCSMSGLANAMASEFSGIAGGVAGVIPDATFGVSTYDDYNYSDMGDSADRPFILHQQQTSDIGLVNAALGGVAIHSGADMPESTMEALYQAATGAGYDQNCNDVFDSGTDVLPFRATVGDAFGGTSAEVYDPDVVGTGELGGFGFRPDVLPIFIYATDADLRDPEAGYRTPDACSSPASGSDVIDAINALGGKAIGVAVGGSTGATNYRQMVEIADGTASYGDMDGDGREEAAAVTWSGGSADFQEIIVEAIDGLVSGGIFDRIWLEVEGSDWGLVESISPEEYTNVPSGDETDFSIEFTGAIASEGTDETYPIRFVLKGQVGVKVLTLDRFTVYVLVPGN